MSFEREFIKIIKILAHGLATGLILQIAIGPVFFFIANLALQKTLYAGLVAVAAVTIVDYLYILLAILGVGKLLEREKTKKILGLISSAVLVFFGLLIIMNLLGNSSIMGESQHDPGTLMATFFAAFALTISSPLTIVFWTGLFSVKAIEKNYSRSELLIFGLAAGLATVLFLSTTVIILTVLKASIPPALVKSLNIAVGLLLVVYGGLRFIDVYRKKTARNSSI